MYCPRTEYTNECIPTIGTKTKRSQSLKKRERLFPKKYHVEEPLVSFQTGFHAKCVKQKREIQSHSIPRFKVV